MRRRIRLPSSYQIIVTRTGGRSYVLSLPILIPLAIFAALALWGGYTLMLARVAREAHSLEERVGELSREVRKLSTQLVEKENRNQALAQQAARMLERLEELESELGALRERAGLKTKKVEKKKSGEDSLGAGRPADTEELFAAVDAWLTRLERELSGEVAPALDRTLRREAATPRGYPITATTRIVSGFGVRRNPFGWGYEFHDGVDLPAWYGAPVYATAPGKVVEAGWSRIFGRYVKLDHGFGFKTLYGHMSRIAVKRGQVVKRGQLVGYVGSTGRSTGPHLHYSVYVNGRPVDPRPYLRLPVLASR